MCRLFPLRQSDIDVNANEDDGEEKGDVDVDVEECRVHLKRNQSSTRLCVMWDQRKQIPERYRLNNLYIINSLGPSQHNRVNYNDISMSLSCSSSPRVYNTSIMSASTSRNGAMAAVRSIKGHRIPSATGRLVVPKPALGTQDWTRQPVSRYSSTQPPAQTQNQSKTKKSGKGKESDRYNYNTSMSFSEDIDPDVRLCLPRFPFF